MTNIKTDKILNVPTLRFPGFTDEWQKCTISQFGDIITGSTPSTSNQDNYTDGVYCWASPSDLNGTKYVYDTKIRLSQKGYDKTRKLPKDAILVTCIGSTIGKMGMSYTEMSTNQQINAVVVNVSFDKDFVYYAIQSRFPKYLTSIAVQAVPILSKSAFGELGNYYPSKLEQKKIGKLLSLLDERIALQSKLIDRLKSLMDGIIDRITTQASNISIAECLECHSSTLQEGETVEIGDCPVYGANGICGYLDYSDISTPAILIVKDGSGVGSVSYTSGGCSVVGTLNYLTPKEYFSAKFLYFILKRFNFQPYKTGMAIPHIYFKTYSKARIFCPDYEEQTRTAASLSRIEDKIALEEKLLFLLHEQKRYLLSAMFI